MDTGPTSLQPSPASGPHLVGIEPCRVLFVASEIYPLAKTGGLADVCAALPPALAAHGVDVRLLMPGYPRALEMALAPRVLVEFGDVLGVPGVRVLAARTPDSALPLWLVDSPGLYRRAGGPYQDERGQEWPDNALRFAVFAQVAARLAGAAVAATGWQPDVVHCHDWHCGLVPLLMKAAGTRARSVFTIHNAAFQGNYPLQDAARLGIGPAHAGCDGVEFYGRLSFLKAGIRYADRVTTVSPTYARELLGTEHGCGMEGVLAARGADFSGILNGIDTRLWNPRSDPHLPRNYCVAEPDGKATCKTALREELGLQPSSDGPLAIMVSRLTRQKMADVVLAELPALLQREPSMQFALLGRGEADLEQGFTALAAAFPGRVSARIDYAEPDAHRLHAAADLLLHGARFEPCGLVQMYAMRYGTVPVVSRVGGLADSVVDADDLDAGTGFVFDGCSGDALQRAIARGIRTWRERPLHWGRLQASAMRRDFGWQQPAFDYLRLYADTMRADHGSAAPSEHHHAYQ